MVQDYEDSQGKRSNYLALSGQFLKGKDSPGLQEFICKYSNRLSYSDVICLLKDMTGVDLVSKQHACNIVAQTATRIVAQECSSMAGQQLCIPFVDSVDIYDRNQTELLVFEDAIGVKSQKGQRNQTYQKPGKTVQTDVMVVQNGIKSKEFSVFAAHKDHRKHLDSQLMYHLSTHNDKGVFPIIVIADGARSIRKRLTELIGNSLVFILDWYHLSDKIWQYMSQIAVNKSQKEEDSKAILALLWSGRVNECIAYLQTKIIGKNQLKKQELIEYLSKHRIEIINYERRKNAGKKIGSGCVEKANDLIVAHRQKKKGMAWSNDGSESLAILKTVEINHKWQQFWEQVA